MPKIAIYKFLTFYIFAYDALGFLSDDFFSKVNSLIANVLSCKLRTAILFNLNLLRIAWVESIYFEKANLQIIQKFFSVVGASHSQNPLDQQKRRRDIYFKSLDDTNSQIMISFS